MRSAIIVAVLFYCGPALAQQQPQIMSAAQRCGQVVGALEGENASLGERFDMQSVDLQKAKTRIKELEDRYEPKAADPAKSPAH